MLTLISAATMSAQTTADVTLRLESESHSVSDLYLFAGPDLAASPERGSFYATQSNPEDINIYAVDPATNGKYSSYGNGTLMNIPVEIITSKEAAAKQNYTIKFEVYEDAEVLKLKDLVTGEEKDIVNGGSYNFTVTEENAPSYQEGTYSVISNRFFINFSAVTSVTTNEFGWATFSYTTDVEPVNPASKVYKGTISDELLNLNEVDYVKAGEGVIVYGAPSTTYYFAVGNGTADFTDNDLKATSTYNTSMKNVYVLKGNAFLEYVGTNALAANKAYIQLPAAGQNNAPARIRMVINGTQGVENVETEAVKAEKFIENGQVYIRRGNEVYNLQGQIVK